MTQHVTESMKLDKFAADLHLEIVYAGRGTVTLSSMSVERPGLALAGFFDYFDPNRVEVLGFAEHEYLRSFPEEIRRKKIADLLAQGDIPCIIVSRDLPVLQELAEEARECEMSDFQKSETDDGSYE